MANNILHESQIRLSQRPLLPYWTLAAVPPATTRSLFRERLQDHDPGPVLLKKRRPKISEKATKRRPKIYEKATKIRP